MTRQHRLNPSKLLVLLLYGSYPYLETDSQPDSDVKRVTLKIGGFAKLMRVRNAHIVEYLDWLEQMGFLTVTKRTKRTATVIIEEPLLFRSDG